MASYKDLMDKPQHVLVDLNEVPLHGYSQVVIRMKESDANDLKRAAKVMGMSREQLVRVASIQTARKIIAETGG